MLYHISNDRLAVTASDLGAQLMSIQNPEGMEYLWQGDPTYWADRALNLFPYIARLTRGQYTYRGKSYHMPIHGFAPTSLFRGRKEAEDCLTFTLEDSTESYAMYPFRFVFSIIYQLKENALQVIYRVENRDQKTMYFAVGGHPGINLPLEEGLKFEDYYLKFGSSDLKRVEFSKDCFVTGELTPFPLEDGILPLHHDLFDDDAIVLKDTPQSVQLMSNKGARGVCLNAPDFPYWGFWHKPMSDAPYICLEPWSALPSRKDVVEDLERKEDLTALPEGQTYERTWSLTFF